MSRSASSGCLALLLLVAVAAPAPALAEDGGSNPFGPLPQQPAPPPEQPEPQPAGNDGADEDGLGGTAFWLIVGSTGAIFAAVAFVITRDMRRTVGARRKPKRTRGSGRLPAATAADALTADPRHRSGSRKTHKAQQRAKTKAARKQRRRARSR